MLRKISTSGDSTFTAQWNEHVEALIQLRKMKAGGGVRITWANGVPTIWGDKSQGSSANIGIGKANGSISNRASGAISIWGGTFGSEADTGNDTTMFNLGPPVVLSDWVTWQIINGQYAFVKLCST